MKKIVSIALFGEGDKYRQYLTAFVLAHLNIFPQSEDWRLRVHVDAKINIDMCYGRTACGWFLARAVERGLLQVQPMGSAPLTKAMLWRFAPAFDPDVDYVFSRDLDAAPMPRDRAACEQFIISKAALHTVHDNTAHAGVMGGLSGVWAPEFRRLTGFTSLDDVYKFAGKTDEEWSQHGQDQHALNVMTVRYPMLTLLEHRFNGWTEGKPTSYRRPAAMYQCEAWSTPMPDRGWASVEFLGADKLGNHLGCAGYDHQAARVFWEQHGSPDIALAVRACEDA